MMSRLIFEPIVCYSRYWNIFVGLTPADELTLDMKGDTTHAYLRRKKGATKYDP